LLWVARCKIPSTYQQTSLLSLCNCNGRISRVCIRMDTHSRRLIRGNDQKSSKREWGDRGETLAVKIDVWAAASDRSSRSFGDDRVNGGPLSGDASFQPESALYDRPYVRTSTEKGMRPIVRRGAPPESRNGRGRFGEGAIESEPSFSLSCRLIECPSIRTYSSFASR